MSQTNLLQLVRNDVDAFLQNNDELFFNERDFQMHLALWLKESANEYDDVDMEYYVPQKTLDGYVWNSELRLDIVIRKGDEYLPVELKYKTKSVVGINFLRFGEDINANVVEPYEIMRNQGAQDLGMYEFWKDIRRIECVRNRFEKVVGGLAIFLTNDLFYKKPNKDASNNYNFSMHNGTHSTCKHWQRQTSTTKDYPDFDLDNEHNIQWQGTKVESVDMYYCIVEVEGLTQQTIKVIGKTQNGAALGVMKAYAVLNSNTTLEGMRNAFPNDIAPDKGVKEMFLPLNEAEAFNQEHNMSLYFTKDGKPIQLKDCEVALSQIWTGKSLQNLIDVAAKYGIKVEVNKEAKVDFGKIGYFLVSEKGNKTED